MVVWSRAALKWRRLFRDTYFTKMILIKTRRNVSEILGLRFRLPGFWISLLRFRTKEQKQSHTPCTHLVNFQVWNISVIEWWRHDFILSCNADNLSWKSNSKIFLVTQLEVLRFKNNLYFGLDLPAARRTPDTETGWTMAQCFNPGNRLGHKYLR